MTIHNDHHQDPNIHQPGVIFAGLRLVKNIIQRLIHLAILTEQERIEAGIYLGRPQI